MPSELSTLQQKASEYLIADPAILQLALLLQLNSCRLAQSLLDFAEDCHAPAALGSITERLAAILFYLAALANAIGLNLDDICAYEIEKLDLLGYIMQLSD